MKHRSLESENLLSGAATRAAEDPTFMANVLKSYAGGQLDFGRLALLFQTNEANIIRLALCRRPGTRTGVFACDVLALAAASGVSVAAVANSLRQVEALDALRKGTPMSLMAAARDHISSSDEGGSKDV